MNASPTTGTLVYTTSGDVGTTAGVPVGTIGFNGSYSFTPLLTPGSFSLGQFSSQPLPAGAGLTYHNMPFYIDVNFYKSLGGSNYVPTSSIYITGLLNGTVTGTTQSDVIATVSSIQAFGPDPLPFPLSSFHIDAPQVLAPPGSGFFLGSLTTLNARIDVAAVPEPASWAVFALAVGAGFYRLRRSR